MLIEPIESLDIRAQLPRSSTARLRRPAAIPRAVWSPSASRWRSASRPGSAPSCGESRAETADAAAASSSNNTGDVMTEERSYALLKRGYEQILEAFSLMGYPTQT